MLLLRSSRVDADFHGGRTATAPAPAKVVYERPLGQGKRNFDMARRGSYVHLVFGGRPRRTGVPSG